MTPPKIRLFWVDLLGGFILSAALLHYVTFHITHILGNVSNIIFEFMNSECSKLVLDDTLGYLTVI